MKRHLKQFLSGQSFELNSKLKKAVVDWLSAQVVEFCGWGVITCCFCLGILYQYSKTHLVLYKFIWNTPMLIQALQSNLGALEPTHISMHVKARCALVMHALPSSTSKTLSPCLSRWFCCGLAIYHSRHTTLLGYRYCNCGKCPTLLEWIKLSFPLGSSWQLEVNKGGVVTGP